MDNLEVVRRIQDAWNANDMATIDQLIAPDFTAHTPGAGMLPPGWKARSSPISRP